MYIYGDSNNLSECILPNELYQIIEHITNKQISQLSKPILLFSSNIDGISLKSLYNKALKAELNPTILLIRSLSKHSVVGAYCSDKWIPNTHNQHFGDGTCFLFSAKPGPLKIYHWIGPDRAKTVQQSFQFAEPNRLVIGFGSGGLTGLSLDAELRWSTSGPSECFDSPCLITDPKDLGGNTNSCTFPVGLVELIGFQEL